MARAGARKAPIAVIEYPGASDGGPKIVIAGDPNSGKTSLMNRYSCEKFEMRYSPTMQTRAETRAVKLRDRTVVAKIVDGPGNARARDNDEFYKDARGCVLVYDITSQPSFRGLPQWLDEIRYFCGGIPVLLVGNKCDQGGDRRITKQAAASFAAAHGMQLIETSARYGTNVADAFRVVLEMVGAAPQGGRRHEPPRDERPPRAAGSRPPRARRPDSARPSRGERVPLWKRDPRDPRRLVERRAVSSGGVRRARSACWSTRSLGPPVIRWDSPEYRTDQSQEFYTDQHRLATMEQRQARKAREAAKMALEQSLDEWKEVEQRQIEEGGSAVREEQELRHKLDDVIAEVETADRQVAAVNEARCPTTKGSLLLEKQHFLRQIEVLEGTQRELKEEVGRLLEELARVCTGSAYAANTARVVEFDDTRHHRASLEAKLRTINQQWLTARGREKRQEPEIMSMLRLQMEAVGECQKRLDEVTFRLAVDKQRHRLVEEGLLREISNLNTVLLDIGLYDDVQDVNALAAQHSEGARKMLLHLTSVRGSGSVRIEPEEAVKLGKGEEAETGISLRPGLVRSLEVIGADARLCFDRSDDFALSDLRAHEVRQLQIPGSRGRADAMSLQVQVAELGLKPLTGAPIVYGRSPQATRRKEASSEVGSLKDLPVTGKSGSKSSTSKGSAAKSAASKSGGGSARLQEEVSGFSEALASEVTRVNPRVRVKVVGVAGLAEADGVLGVRLDGGAEQRFPIKVGADIRCDCLMIFNSPNAADGCLVFELSAGGGLIGRGVLAVSDGGAGEETKIELPPSEGTLSVQVSVDPARS